MALTEPISINFTGGIVSPGYLKDVLEIAASNKVTHVSFGLRQQLIMEVPGKHLTQFINSCEARNISIYRKKDSLPNVVSSYPAAGIFTTDTWMREGVYKDIFNMIDYQPKVKVNICDSTQSFVPFFTGHLNWISSNIPHYWYLYIRFFRTKTVVCFPELIYTNHIADLSKAIEPYLLDGDGNLNELYLKVKSEISFEGKPVESELKFPQFYLPYYEGFSKFENSYWLGIYRRDELFQVQFLIDLCSLCMHSKIGEIYTTPWKSIIIKGINRSHRKGWDYVLGNYRINVRHAANELNWQVDDFDEEGLMLKRHIIRHFDKEDVRTYGLSFAIQTFETSNLFATIIIKKQPPKGANRLRSLDRFDIYHTRDFNANSSDIVLFRSDVAKEYLGPYLVSLCKLFYEIESAPATLTSDVPQASVATNSGTDEKQGKQLHQCKYCLTTYDDSLGDIENNVAPGTPFEALPESYQCPLCDAAKEDFIIIDESNLELIG